MFKSPVKQYINSTRTSPLLQAVSIYTILQMYNQILISLINLFESAILCIRALKTDECSTENLKNTHQNSPITMLASI